MAYNVSRPLANHKYRKNVFTLVELIVVLVIIGILLALVIPSLTGWIDRASTKSAMAECRVAVNAAQSLSIEHYTSATAATVTDAEVVAFAKLPGTVSNMEFENSTLLHLTYANKYTITYCRNFASCVDHAEMYNLIKYQSWSSSTVYQTGDKVVVDGIIFARTAYRPGSSGYNPSSSKNNNVQTWEIIGFENEIMNYSHIYRYAAGTVVTGQDGKKYKRTNHNLTAGIAPPSAQYWTPIE